MFGFLKRGKSEQQVFADLKTDMHSHLIPGIDDGAKTMNESIELIQNLQSLGYEKIITTPHIYQEYYPNTSDIIKRGLEELHLELKNRGIAVEIEAAAEYFMDENFEQLLAKKDLLTFGKNKKYVLVEMSFFFEPPNLMQYIFELCSKGYSPILAHPERYLFLTTEFERYHQFKEHGCLLQMNILSLLGGYGKGVQQNANRMLKAGLFDLMGTDLHHKGHFEGLRKAQSNAKIGKMIKSEKIINSLI